jgi:hypothetical protein
MVLQGGTLVSGTAQLSVPHHPDATIAATRAQGGQQSYRGRFAALKDKTPGNRTQTIFNIVRPSETLVAWQE